MKYYVDGGCRNNQDAEKREAYGSWASMDEILLPVRLKFGNKTSNEAEYLALLDCLEWCWRQNEYSSEELKENPSDIVYTDSQLIDGHINKGWKCKPHLKPLRDRAKQLIELLNIKVIKVPREEIEKVLGH